MSTNPVVQSLVNAEAAIEEAKAQVEANEELAKAAPPVETIAAVQGVEIDHAALEAAANLAPSTEPSHIPLPETNPVTRDEFDLLLEQFRDLTNRVQDFNRRSGQQL